MIIDFRNIGGGGGSGYTLPVATSEVLGGVMVGSGLSITSAGTLSADGVDLSDYVQEQELSGYVPTTRVATSAQTGLVKIGSGINIDSAGTISVSGGGSNVEPATNISSGIITVGDGLAVDENGVVSVGNQVMRFNSEYDEGDDSYSWSEYTKNEISFDIAKITIEDVEVSNTDGFVLINLRYEYQIAFEMKVDADNAYLYFRNDGIEEYEYQTSGDTFKADKIEVYFFTGETITSSPSPYKMAIYIDGNQVFSATDLSWQSKYEDINIFSEQYSEDVYAHIGKITVESMNGDVRTYKPIVTSNGVQFAYYVDGEYDGALDLANNLDGTIIALPKQEKQIGVATTASTGVVKIGSGINVASDGTISVSGGDVQRATTTNWGTMLLGNGIGLETNDGAVVGISAGDNILYGNGDGVVPQNDSKKGGVKAPVYEYTRYDLDITDDEDNCIRFMDEGTALIEIDNLDFAANNSGILLKLIDNEDRYVLFSFNNNGLNLAVNPYLNRNRIALPNTDINFSNYDDQYKTIRVYFDYDDGNDETTVQVFGKNDDYDAVIGSFTFSGEFAETINHIQIFDDAVDMGYVGIGQITINNTDIIKPYFEWDGEEITNCGFVLRKRSFSSPW